MNLEASVDLSFISVKLRVDRRVADFPIHSSGSAATLQEAPLAGRSHDDRAASGFSCARHQQPDLGLTNLPGNN